MKPNKSSEIFSKYILFIKERDDFVIAIKYMNEPKENYVTTVVCYFVLGKPQKKFLR